MYRRMQVPKVWWFAKCSTAGILVKVSRCANIKFSFSRTCRLPNGSEVSETYLIMHKSPPNTQFAVTISNVLVKEWVNQCEIVIGDEIMKSILEESV